MIFRRQEVVWLFLILACLGSLFLYQGQAGKGAEAPPRWPGLLSPGENFTLILFVHPGCPCTRASLRDLERFTAGEWEGLRTYAVFTTPAGVEPGFHKTDLWRLANRIPRVTALLDQGGQLSQEFGCFTSGQVLLYDREGELKFAGGITASRGHEGPSIGLEAITMHLQNRVGVNHVEVYGCPISSEGEQFCHR